MDTAKVVRIAEESQGGKGEMMAKAIEDGMLSADAKREYQDMLAYVDDLKDTIRAQSREIRFLENNIRVQELSNGRFRKIYTDAFYGEKPEPTKWDKAMSVGVAGLFATGVVLTVILGYLIVKYCI